MLRRWPGVHYRDPVRMRRLDPQRLAEELARPAVLEAYEADESRCHGNAPAA